ncbi:MAG: hypothetical protein LUD00_01880 [Prevotellaceae bacterium]|nr:hypothetical protein [Prevotellaceae bacterium]
MYSAGCFRQTPPSLRATSPNLGEEPIYHSGKANEKPNGDNTQYGNLAPPLS